ncbi:TPA: ethanolamine utilization phosphate acetyltransferase EutD [Clostridioides difficile]|uniref:ethanolamine utilization phosphate acetyltransferase EutD n=1 Tax=Clostridioides difficile TaxID=1496 RepID=UPI00097FD90B|nr:ethanolamine utilization phosphate acetyltransferase EutD [Clostridioides difficile]EGT4534352.1 phosphate propanoyltransferase [Clostridioides difficile]MDV9928523.1 ethanolamine utilization phosphate acetyltransferase EutD [Clostridioides difficile]MDV9989275.1 ethanolamine utilization phosphate acetyltransferase EutD [Clostridioides difficile]SJO22229.1 Phosphate propanoyltransferase [Clostridioides difficile]HBE8909365.1 phosphate propanoyltransferase [Clostridioides difficile]
MENLLNEIVEEVITRVKKEAFIEVEASGRHVHLSREDVDKLFGEGYTLTKLKDLSQPGQYACKERVTITGPKGSIKNVVVLGPCRNETQVEISLTDGSTLGLKAPIKQSGDLEGTLSIKISTQYGEVELDKGLMVAKRHIHMTHKDAEKFNVCDKEIVEAKVMGQRPLTFDDVVIRVSDSFKTYMHIDYDEANACGYSKGTVAKIIKKA